MNRGLACSASVRRQLEFGIGNVTDYYSSKRFDAVISLFHVVSYQTSYEAMRGIFKVAESHLSENGLFLFDIWYGPAVLSQKPIVRVKRVQDSKTALIRIAEPVLDANRSTVRVDYSIFCTDKASGEISSCDESHLVRYFFLPELELLLSEANMEIVLTEEWVTGKTPGIDTWGVCIVCRRLIKSK